MESPAPKDDITLKSVIASEICWNSSVGAPFAFKRQRQSDRRTAEMTETFRENAFNSFNVSKSFLWFYFSRRYFLIAIFNDKDLTQITDFS